MSTMVVFRCTQKLRRRMGHAARTETPAAKSSGRLGDWYANAVSVHRRHVVLAVSGVTLVPVLVEAAPYKTMTSRFVAATGEGLRALGVPDANVYVVLAVSGGTLVPVLVEAAPYKTMTSRFVAATGEVLRALGVPDANVAVE